MRTILAVVATFLLAALLTFQFSAARAMQQPPAPPPARPSRGEAMSPRAQEIDLDGEYSGRLNSDLLDLHGPARLIISGRAFRLLGDRGTEFSGTISTRSAGSHIDITLRVMAGPVKRTLSLRALKRVTKPGRSIAISSTSGAPSEFVFITDDLWRPAGGRIPRPHTTDSNTNTSANTRSDADANTSANRLGEDSEPDMEFDNGRSADSPGRSRDSNTRGTGSGRRNGRAPRVDAPGGTPQNETSPPPPPEDDDDDQNNPPADVDGILDEELKKQIHEGRLALRAPDSMRQGVAHTVTARLAAEDLGEKLTQGMTGGGNTTVEAVEVGRVMKVELSAEDGEAFRIEAHGDAEKVIRAGRFAEWQWSVTPLKSGPQVLRLHGAALVKIPGRGEKASPLKTIDKRLTVDVNYPYVAKAFVKDNWELITGGVSIPAILGWLWKKFKSDKSKGEGGAAGGDQ